MKKSNPSCLTCFFIEQNKMPLQLLSASLQSNTPSCSHSKGAFYSISRQAFRHVYLRSHRTLSKDIKSFFISLLFIFPRIPPCFFDSVLSVGQITDRALAQLVISCFSGLVKYKPWKRLQVLGTVIESLQKSPWEDIWDWPCDWPVKEGSLCGTVWPQVSDGVGKWITYHINDRESKPWQLVEPAGHVPKP